MTAKDTRKTKQIPNNDRYLRTQMQKEKIMEMLREKGCRVTKQRQILLDIILEKECSCIKEIYFETVQVDDTIGIATIYRLVNMLEDIGAISRKNLYKVAYPENCTMANACTVVLSDGTTRSLSGQEWNAVLKAGMQAGGYITEQQNVVSASVHQCTCDKGCC